MRLGLLLRVAMASAFVSLWLSAGGCQRSFKPYLPPDWRIAMLDVNQPAPFKGLLITEAYYLYLLEQQEK